MRLLVLFSCVCLQMAASPGPMARAVRPGEPVVQRDPGHSAASLPQAEQEAAEFVPLSRFFAPRLKERFIPSLAALLGPKDFLIRTGLSPPLAIG